MMDAHDACLRLRRALDRLQKVPQPRVRLCLVNDPPGVSQVALVGVSTNNGVLVLHLEVECDPGTD